MDKLNGLNKNEKLKSRKEIENLFSKRLSFAVSSVRVFYSVQNNDEKIKAGFGCSKKYFKQAVYRNRAKRLMREAYRTQKHSLLEIAAQQKKSVHAFFLFSNNHLTDYEEMCRTIFIILQKLEKILKN